LKTLLLISLFPKCDFSINLIYYASPIIPEVFNTSESHHRDSKGHTKYGDGGKEYSSRKGSRVSIRRSAELALVYLLSFQLYDIVIYSVYAATPAV
jgi:hypothetical protein